MSDFHRTPMDPARLLPILAGKKAEVTQLDTIIEYLSAELDHLERRRANLMFAIKMGEQQLNEVSEP